MSQIQIKRGDTLSQIARDNNISIEELVRLNNIQDVNKIYAGDMLTIASPNYPMAAPTTPPTVSYPMAAPTSTAPPPVASTPTPTVMAAPETPTQIPLPEESQQNNFGPPIPRPKTKPTTKKNTLSPKAALYLKGVPAYQASKLFGKPPPVYTEKDTDIFSPEYLGSVQDLVEHFYGDNGKENQEKFIDSRPKKEKEKMKKAIKNNQVNYEMINHFFKSDDIFKDGGINVEGMASNVKLTLGQFSVKKDKKNNWKIRDRYDFSPVSLAKSVGGAIDKVHYYPLARYGGGLLAPELSGGKSSKHAPYINLTIPRRDKDIREV